MLHFKWVIILSFIRFTAGDMKGFSVALDFYLYTQALDTLDFMTIREVDRLHPFALFYLFGDLSLAQIGAER